VNFRKDDSFDAESYVKVNVRLMEFWEAYPEGRIETQAEIIGEGLVVKALLYMDQSSEKPFATGHAFLPNLDGDKVGEYTETVAVGRALAFKGFRVEKSIASGEEMQRWHDRKQESQPKIKSEADAPKEPQEVSSTPEVPMKLKPARVFKPLAKS
jgi:hypothetical protein